MLLKQFIIKTVFLALVTSLLCLVIFVDFFPLEYNVLYIILPVIFGLANIGIYKFIISTQEKSLSKFSSRYLLCTTIKLLGSTFFIVIYLLFNKEHAVSFLSTFLAVYFIFLFQEIFEILKYFKKKEKSESTHAKS